MNQNPLPDDGLEGEAMQCKRQALCDRAYGCVQVKSGSEKKVARTMEQLFPEIEAHAVVQIKHRSHQGVRTYASDVMLSGYVVFQAAGDLPVSQFLTISAVHRILKYDGKDWHLRNTDLSFAQWVFDHQGMIGVSSVYMKGDRIQIIDGPLKTLKGEIVRIDKRNRNALVSLGFDQQTFKAWLAFEWMDRVG